MTTLTRNGIGICPRCRGNLLRDWEGMKCLQCSRTVGGPELEGFKVVKHYDKAFKEQAVARARELGSWSRAAREFGVDPGGLQMWGYKL